MGWELVIFESPFESFLWTKLTKSLQTRYFCIILMDPQAPHGSFRNHSCLHRCASSKYWAHFSTSLFVSGESPSPSFIGLSSNATVSYRRPPPPPSLKATKTEKCRGVHILPQFSEISVPLFSDIEKNNCFTLIYARSDLYNSRSKHLQNPFKVNLNDVSKRRPFCFV